MGRSRKRRRWPWVILFTAIALVGVFYVGGAWYFSGQVYADALKAEPYDPADLQRGTVQAYDGTGEQATVTILPDEADRDETKFDNAVIGSGARRVPARRRPCHARCGRRADPARPRRDRQRTERRATGMA